MTDARLDELEGLAAAGVGSVSGRAFKDAMTELRRLRAELAARPEPIGYVATWQTGLGSIKANGHVWPTVAQARSGIADYADPDSYELMALVPIEATP
jgi:hypothetical protein